ncbi:TlpA family protein disulfide reductase [bacterium]|nr:TlpA family protein disulfide reductase [bacterium]
MKKITFIIITIIIAISIFVGCSKENNSAPSNTANSVLKTDKENNSAPSNTPHSVLKTDSAQKFQKAPDFNLPTLDGKQVRLSDFDGKVIIIDFWATWCRPCVMEMPSYVKLMNKYADKPFIVIGIGLDRRITKNQLNNFLKSHNINYPILLGLSDPTILDRYGGIPSIPTTFIIDKQGYIRQKLVGFHKYEDLENIVSRLLEEKITEK